MRISNIIKTSAGATLGALAINLGGCTNNPATVSAPVQTVVKTAPNPNYANLVISPGYNTAKQNIKIENGVSFIAANDIKYTAKNGQMFGEYTYYKDTKPFIIGKRKDFTIQTYETLKMLAGFTKEADSPDTLTLSKNDINEAVKKLKNGRIWNDAKEFFAKDSVEYLYFGKLKALKPNGIDISINTMGQVLSKVKFMYK